MNGYICQCGWLGTLVDWHRKLEKLDDGPPFYTIVLTCPDCGNDALNDVHLCVACLDQGIEVEATHDDYCKPHAVENFDPEDMEDFFRRDRQQPVRALVKT